MLAHSLYFEMKHPRTCKKSGCKKTTRGAAQQREKTRNGEVVQDQSSNGNALQKRQEKRLMTSSNSSRASSRAAMLSAGVRPSLVKAGMSFQSSPLGK